MLRCDASVARGASSAGKEREQLLHGLDNVGWGVFGYMRMASFLDSFLFLLLIICGQQ